MTNNFEKNYLLVNLYSNFYNVKEHMFCTYYILIERTIVLRRDIYKLLQIKIRSYQFLFR